MKILDNFNESYFWAESRKGSDFIDLGFHWSLGQIQQSDWSSRNELPFLGSCHISKGSIFSILKSQKHDYKFFKDQIKDKADVTSVMSSDSSDIAARPILPPFFTQIGSDEFEKLLLIRFPL